MTRLRSWLAAGRPEQALLAPLAVAVGSAYARFDARPGPGVFTGVALFAGAYAAGFGVSAVDDAWDSEDGKSHAAVGAAALFVAAACGMAAASASSSAVLGYGALAIALGVLRRAPVIG